MVLAYRVRSLSPLHRPAVVLQLMTTVPEDCHAWVRANLTTIADLPQVIERFPRAGYGHLDARTVIAHVLDSTYRNPTPHLPGEDFDGVFALDGRPMQVRRRLQRPGAVVLDGFLTPAECDWMIDHARDAMRRSTAIDANKGHRGRSVARTSCSYDFRTHFPNPLIERIERRIASLTGLPVENGELLQISRYREGEYFLPHCDWFPRDRLETLVQLMRGGQRISTVILYLNDVAAGGYTAFPRAGIAISPHRGSALWFSNIDASGREDILSQHCGEPVLRGEKWIATKWIRAGAAS